MATVTLKGNAIHTSGDLPAVGSEAPNFKLVLNDLSSISLGDFKGSNLILNVFPSIDTDTCAASVRKFNEQAAALENTKVLCISRDLPFAQARFCGAEGIKNVINLSDFRDREFGRLYGQAFIDGPLEGLLARSIVVIDGEGNVAHTEQVAEIVDEPNYQAALDALTNE
ncbi:thiol peroxidase [Spongiivirga sp. MCCC 1A20706]|uniref:thiol peroxidase n=1 Tax=Spongiivirga sp. MCCC 1A20706 TaxID=3160963 RepID=UPI003977D313